MSGQLDPIQLMKTINELEYKISALATIQTGGIWTDWTPTVTASGSMTIASLSVQSARYSVIGRICFINYWVQFTTGGTADTTVYITAPSGLTIKDVYTNFTTNIVNGGDLIPGLGYRGSSTQFAGLIASAGNWGLGTLRSVLMTGFYEIAQLHRFQLCKLDMVTDAYKDDYGMEER